MLQLAKISSTKSNMLLLDEPTSHFDRDYLEIEQKIKSVETKIALALQDNDFTLARALCEELESLIKLI